MSDLNSGKDRCRDCGEVKSASEFWRRKQSPDGLSLYCRACFGLRNAAGYRKRQAAIGKTPRAYRRHSAVPDGLKYCARCAETKPLADLGRNRADPRGLATYCKPCHNRVMAEIKAKNHGSVRSWEIGQIGGHDLAVPLAFARDDSGDPWEFDVDVADPGPVEPRFPVLDLSDLRDDAPRPTGPPHPAEYALL